MIYRSNIEAPDLQPHFAATTICKPRDWSMGHDVLSDAVYGPDCGFMTHDEAAILYECSRRIGGRWVDIGSRMMWSTAHIAAAGVEVCAVDPAYCDDRFRERTGILAANPGKIRVFPLASIDFFAEALIDEVSGVCIDGNHDDPEPLNDARRALGVLADTGVIVLHDFWGQPIRDAARYLMDEGLKCVVYNTPNGMAVCWRGEFVPPSHVPDPSIDWAAVRFQRAPEWSGSLHESMAYYCDMPQRVEAIQAETARLAGEILSV